MAEPERGREQHGGGQRVPTVIVDELHVVYRVNGAKGGKGSATAALSRILRRGGERASIRPDAG